MLDQSVNIGSSSYLLCNSFCQHVMYVVAYPNKFLIIIANCYDDCRNT